MGPREARHGGGTARDGDAAGPAPPRAGTAPAGAGAGAGAEARGAPAEERAALLPAGLPPGTLDMMKGQVGLRPPGRSPLDEPPAPGSKKRRLVRTLLSVAAWYSSGVFLSITNKHLMLYHGFQFPIALTFVHMVMCGVLANVAVVQFRLVERETLRSRDHFRRVCVLAAVFTGTVLMGNWSLKYVHVSFTLMVGATTPFFTAALAYLLQRRAQAPLVYAALVPVIGGSVLAAYGEVNFHLLGYLLALGATVARAFKSLLQGELLQSPEDKLHSQNLLRFMCPIAAGLLFVPALAVEGRALHRWVQAVGPTGLAAFLPLFGANVLCAYGVNLANFLVTRFLGPLTLQVLGQAKGVVTTSVAVVFFGNAVSALAWVGYTITLSGVSLYIAAQHGKARLSPAWPCVGRLGPRRYAKVVGGPA